MEKSLGSSMSHASDLSAICSSLVAAGHSVVLRSFSAIDRFLEMPDLPFIWLDTDADISVLARLVEGLRFPGPAVADAAADTPDATWYFRCLDAHEKGGYSFPLLSFCYDWARRRFLDPLGVYPLLKAIRKDLKTVAATGSKMVAATVFDVALAMARYGGVAAEENWQLLPPPPTELQRAYLNCILVSKRPDAALGFLKAAGVLDALWPELADYDSVDHSKEFHPEGNVWAHTLETFRHRKAGANGAYDLRLSLGLLLHDMGKPISASFGSRRFDGHAELGARAARRFLKRLGYEGAIIDDIFYLVKNHMLPAALKRLPLTKTSEIMRSSLFPTLMELYRCDESSSFKPLDNFHENSAAYQVYLKNMRNPYRSADGALRWGI